MATFRMFNYKVQPQCIKFYEVYLILLKFYRHLKIESNKHSQTPLSFGRNLNEQGVLYIFAHTVKGNNRIFESVLHCTIVYFI